MNVQLRVEGIFYFNVSLGLVKNLMQLSKHHYDGVCQRASARVGQKLRPGHSLIQPENGILTIWFDRFEHGASDHDKVEVRCKWNEIDLLAKICENPNAGLSGRSYSQIAHFRGQLTKMVQIAGPLLVSKWHTEFDV